MLGCALFFFLFLQVPTLASPSGRAAGAPAISPMVAPRNAALVRVGCWAGILNNTSPWGGGQRAGWGWVDGFKHTRGRSGHSTACTKIGPLALNC